MLNNSIQKNKKAAKRLGNSAILLAEYINLKKNKNTLNKNITKDDYKSILEILDKPKEDRATKDNIFISSVLEKSDLVKKFQNEKISKSNLYRLIYNVAQSMKFHKIKEEEVLFREGEIGDYFYIIIWGSMDILKRKEKEEKMTGEEYLRYLQTLRDNYEFDQFEQTVLANKSSFPFEQKHFENIMNVIFEMKFRKSLMIDIKKIDDVKKFFVEYGVNPVEFDQNLQKFPQMKHLNIQRNPLVNPNVSSQVQKPGKSILKNKIARKYEKKNSDSESFSELDEEDNEKLQLNLLSIKRTSIQRINRDLDIEKYAYINSSEKKTVKIFYNYNFLTLKSGAYFGDTALEKKGAKRTATLKAHEDTLLGYIDEATYKKYLFEERERMKIQEISFLIENFYFQGVKYNTFKKQYFDSFALFTKIKGEVLFHENQINDFLYFIIEGQCELSINIDFFKFIELIRKLAEIVKFKLENFDIDPNIQEQIKSELSKVRNYKVFICEPKQVLGLFEFLHNLNKLFKCTVHSSTVKYYTLENEKQKEFCNRDKTLIQSLHKTSNSRIEFIICRLLDIKNAEVERISNEHFYKKNTDNLINSEKFVKLFLNNNDKKQNLTFRLNTISKKLHMFNPLLMTKNSSIMKNDKKVNFNLEINENSLKIPLKQEFIQKTDNSVSSLFVTSGKIGLKNSRKKPQTARERIKSMNFNHKSIFSDVFSDHENFLSNSLIQETDIQEEVGIYRLQSKKSININETNEKPLLRRVTRLSTIDKIYRPTKISDDFLFKDPKPIKIKVHPQTARIRAIYRKNQTSLQFDNHENFNKSPALYSVENSERETNYSKVSNQQIKFVNVVKAPYYNPNIMNLKKKNIKNKVKQNRKSVEYSHNSRDISLKNFPNFYVNSNLNPNFMKVSDETKRKFKEKIMKKNKEKVEMDKKESFKFLRFI